MRYKKFRISILLLMGLGLTGIKAQTMLLNQTTGKQTQYFVSDIRKMIFSDDGISIVKTTGVSDDIALSLLHSITFKYTTGMEVIGQEERHGIVQLYPNPTGDYITVVLDKGKNTSGVIEILSPEGRVLFKKQIICERQMTIDLSAFPHGIYLCRYRAGTTLKTTKVIKL